MPSIMVRSMTVMPITSPSAKMISGPASTAPYLNPQLALSRIVSRSAASSTSSGVNGLRMRSLTKSSRSTSGESAAKTNTIPISA